MVACSSFSSTTSAIPTASRYSDRRAERPSWETPLSPRASTPAVPDLVTPRLFDGHGDQFDRPLEVEAADRGCLQHVRFWRVPHHTGDYSGRFELAGAPIREHRDDPDRVTRRGRLPPRAPGPGSRFDGRFVVGVLTTGVFCRPACPAPQAAQDNVRYFATSAAALHAGYRPCLRCRPERTQLPAWTVGSETVIEALRSIEEGFLDHRPVRALAHRLGIGERHLNRLFMRELGATPRALARMQRIATAKRLLDDTDLPISDVALCAGYGSLRRCNDELRRVFGRRRASCAGRSGVMRSRRPAPLAGPRTVERGLDVSVPRPP